MKFGLLHTKNQTITQNLNGAAMTWYGPSTLTLTGANTLSGNLSVKGGMVQVGTGANNVGSFSAAATASVASGSTLSWWNSTTSTITVANTITGAGTILFRGPSVAATQQGLYSVTANLTNFTGSIVADNCRAIFTSPATVGGSSTLVVRNVGQIFVTGTGTVPNPISIEANANGWIEGGGNYGNVRCDSTITYTGNIAIASGASLKIGGNNSSSSVFSGVISGAGSVSLAPTGVGTCEFSLAGSSSNTFTGGLNLSINASGKSILLRKTGGAVAIPGGSTVTFSLQCNLRMGDSSTTGASRNQWDNQFGTTNNGVLINFTAASGTWGRFDLRGTNQQVRGVSCGTLSTQGGGILQNQGLSGFAPGNDGTLTIAPVSGDSYIFNGIIRDADNSTHVNKLHIVKTGAGTQVIANNNTNTGNTTISQGILAFTGTNTTATTTVASGAAITGLTATTGSVQALVFSAVGSKLRVETTGGSTVGRLTATSVTAASGLTVDLVNPMNAGTYTIIACTGSLPATLPTLGTNGTGKALPIVFAWVAGTGLRVTIPAA